MTWVRTWLSGLGLSQYADTFEANDLDRSTLPKIDNADLLDLGIQSLGHRKKLLGAIAALTDNEHPVEHSPPPRTADDGERRLITVMFCDLVGSTELSTHLDAEDMDAVIRRYQETVVPIVHEYDGHVARFAGDGILSYFGYPNAIEKEAERAIRTALKVAQKVAGTELMPGIRSRVRIGIATGGVVIGGLYERGLRYEAMATGETPNLAARLQSFASPGGIAVCDTTRRLAGAAFDYQDQGPRTLRGFSEEVRIWLVTGMAGASSGLETPAAAPGRERIRGREAEFNELMAAWRKTRLGEGTSILLRGEAGIGKSHLLNALRDAIPTAEAQRLNLNCQPYARSTPFHPVIELLNRVMRMGSEDTPEERRNHLLSFCRRELSTSARNIALLAHLLGISNDDDRAALAGFSPQRLRDDTIDELARAFSGRALIRPLILQVEDLHWADASTLQFLEVLANRIQSLPVLLVMTARPDTEIDWRSELNVSLIELRGLSKHDLAEIVDIVSGADQLPDQIKRQIVEKSDGIPLFVEELTRSVMDEISHRGAENVTEVRFDHASVPDALQNTLMARLDRLGNVKKLALHCAVVGRDFERDLIAHLIDEDAKTVTSSLERLVDAKLLQPRPDLPNAAYSFSHALLRDAAYNNLLKNRRRKIHRKVARVLQAQYPQRVRTQPEILAHHLTEGADYVSAVTAWVEAGTHALQSSANIEAVEHLRKGQSLLCRLEDETLKIQAELRLCMTIGPALIAIRGFAAPEVQDAFGRAREICEQIGTSELLFPVLRGLMAFYTVHGEYAPALAIGSELEAVLARKPSSGRELEWRWNMASPLLWRGDLKSALQHLERGLNLYDPLHHAGHVLEYGQDPGIALRSHLALACNLAGQYDRARKLEADTQVLAETLNHPFSKAQFMGFLQQCHATRREYRSLHDVARDSLEFCKVQGFPVWQGLSMVDLGCSMTYRGDATGMEMAENGLALYAATGAVSCKSRYLNQAAAAYLDSGDLARARVLVEQASRHCEAHQERMFEPEVNVTLTRLMLAEDPQGSREGALELLNHCLETARNSGARHQELLVAMTMKQFEQDGLLGPGPGGDSLAAVLDALAGEPDVPILAEARKLAAA